MGTSEHSFPALSREQVLALSNEQKMEYLKALQVKHKKLEGVAKDLLNLLSPHNETNILAIIGATGVGKTTLSRRLIKTLIEVHLASEGIDYSSVPFIYISAPANGDKSISWVSIYERILHEAHEILVDKKHTNIVQDGLMTIQPKRYRTLAALRDALESMMINRRVKVLVIDEAFHLLRFGNYSAVMDTLKSLADQSKIKLLLVGSYDLFDLVSNYGQVARRAEILHFERYDIDKPADVREFTRVIERIQGYWPLKLVPTFNIISKELMEASLGCVGLLKATLLHALSLQIDNNGAWDPRYLAKATKSLKLLNRIREEIREGEVKVKGAVYGETIFSGKMLDDIAVKMQSSGES